MRICMTRCKIIYMFIAIKLRGNDLTSDLNGCSYTVMHHFQGFHL
jgi:hypothetical protein